MTETAPSLQSSPPSSRRAGGRSKTFSKSIFVFIFVAGLLTTATWSHFLQEFYSYDALLQTASKATTESLEIVMGVLMETAVKTATDVANAAATAVAATTTSENDGRQGTNKAQTRNEPQTTISSRTNSSASVTVKRIAAKITSSSAPVTVERIAITSSAAAASSKGLNRLTDIYEAIANVTRHGGVPWPNPKSTKDACQHYTVWTRHEYANNHSITTESSSTFTPNLTLTSSVEFIGCCGLGHRLSRMAGAAHIAYELETTFLSHWGCCGNTNVFYDLFGFDPILFGQRVTPRPKEPPPPPPPPPQKLVPVVNNETKQQQQKHNQHKHHLQFRFETPPFQNLKKAGVHCPCTQDKIDSDFIFYSTLRNRYTRTHDVDAFVQQHFYNRTSIGLHIRAGNGEQGDFARKGRAIADNAEFVHNTIAGIHELLRNATTTTTTTQNNDNDSASAARPLPHPVLFIATDTPHFIQDFRVALNGTMSVVELKQPRQEEGQGVLFGEFSKVTSRGDECMDGWHSAVQDQLILSHADIIMAAKTSSFTQSLPLSIATGRVQYPDSPHNQPRRRVIIKKPFCEGVPPHMTCFESVGDWCCNTLDKKPTYHDVVPSWREWV